MNDGAGLYERMLLAGGGAVPPLKPPRASAAVVLWRRKGGVLEVYWIRRGRGLPFMAGWHAFPGGAKEPLDEKLPLKGSPSHDAEARTSSSPDFGTVPSEPDLAPGIVACAARELFEEAGILLGGDSTHPSSRAFRLGCLNKSSDFADGLAERGWRLDASRLGFAGRWLTPPFGAVRFDNRFFLCEWHRSDGDPSVVPPENESGEWIEPDKALDALDDGRAFAAPPIVHLLRVLAEVGPDRALPRLLDTSEANLGPLRRIELRPHVLLFPLAAATLPPASHTNAFVLGSRDCVLVDPGSPFDDENERLLAALEAARETLGRRVSEIWLTHHHPDHVAGVGALRAALGVPVAAHAATAERLAPRGIVVDRELRGGERVELAGEPAVALRLHHTPGHARGHLAIEVERTGGTPGSRAGGDLLCGDLVAGFGTIVIDPPEGDMDDYLDSLNRMRGRDYRTLFPAHGAPILDVDAKLDEYVAHRTAREEQVLACWNDGAREPGAMIATVYPDVPPAVHPLAERQIVAHLERLRRRGAISG